MRPILRELYLFTVEGGSVKYTTKEFTKYLKDCQIPFKLLRASNLSHPYILMDKDYKYLVDWALSRAGVQEYIKLDEGRQAYRMSQREEPVWLGKFSDTFNSSGYFMSEDGRMWSIR